MTIVCAVLDDLVDVLALEREVVEVPHWPEAEYRAIVEATVESVRRCLLVAREGKMLVGFAVGKAVDAEAELESVVVKASSRRRGVGRSLCEAVLEWALKQGALRMELEVRASSVGAIALYTQLEFVVVGRRRGYYAEPGDDAVLMRVKERWCR